MRRLLVLLAFALTVAAQGEQVIFVKDHAYVSLRQVAEWLGYDVMPRGDTAVVCSRPRRTVVLPYCSTTTTENGKRITTPAPILFDRHTMRTYLRWECARTRLGADVTSDDLAGCITIHHPTDGRSLPLYYPSWARKRPVIFDPFYETEEWKQFKQQLDALNAAIIAHDVEKVKQLLQATPSLLYWQRYYPDPVELAASIGHRDLVELFLQYGAAPSPFTAVRNGKLDVLQCLLDYGVKCNPVDHNGNTPLAWAVWKHRNDMVELLLAKGANVQAGSIQPLTIALHHHNKALATALARAGARLQNITDPDGCTLLHRAVRCGHVELVQLLVSLGADVNARDNMGHTPLHLMSSGWYSGIIEGEVYDPRFYAFGEMPPMFGNVAYHNYDKIDYPGMLSYLLEHGADVNAVDKSGDSVLRIAAEENMLDVAAVLLEHGAQVNPADDKVASPVGLVRTPKMAELLCNAGADPNRRYAGFLVMRPEDPLAGQKIKIFLEHGLQPDLRGWRGETLLHHAASCGLADVAELLIAAGAPVNAVDDDGNTPLHSSASSHDTAKAAEALLAHGAEINARNRAGQTALLRIVQDAAMQSWSYGSDWPNRSREFIGPAEVLLQHGADPNIADTQGVTPLLALAQHDALVKSGGMLKLLLANGARANARDARGNTALHLLVAQGNNPSGVIAMLLDAGADVNARNTAGLTALGIARQQRRREIKALNRRAKAFGEKPRLPNSSLTTLIDTLVAHGGKE